MTAEELKSRLQEIINELDELDDSQEIRMVTNTYFLGDCRMFIGVSGYNGGYINPERLIDYDD